MIEELGDKLIPVMAISCTFMFFAIWVVAATVDSLYKTFCNSRLKERLIERGASASEIHHIVKAGTEEAEDSSYVEPVPPVKSRDNYQVSNSAY